ncbi:hypothetical protein LIER_36318 [Lithospermum erythrorhizon]|uniref:Uncharacterized protein n=1 Tax=Lithospermum erythrorhizon TaxID=34254 RepID=A0AAV3P8R9_LITER
MDWRSRGWGWEGQWGVGRDSHRMLGWSGVGACWAGICIVGAGGESGGWFEIGGPDGCGPVEMEGGGLDWCNHGDERDNLGRGKGWIGVAIYGWWWMGREDNKGNQTHGEKQKQGLPDDLNVHATSEELKQKIAGDLSGPIVTGGGMDGWCW